MGRITMSRRVPWSCWSAHYECSRIASGERNPQSLTRDFRGLHHAPPNNNTRVTCYPSPLPAPLRSRTDHHGPAGVIMSANAQFTPEQRALVRKRKLSLRKIRFFGPSDFSDPAEMGRPTC